MNDSRRVDEVARLLSGDQISEAARHNAEDLLAAAALRHTAKHTEEQEKRNDDL